MYCRKCGKEIDDNVLVCPHCGVRTDDSKKGSGEEESEENSADTFADNDPPQQMNNGTTQWNRQ